MQGRFESKSLWLLRAWVLRVPRDALVMSTGGLQVGHDSHSAKLIDWPVWNSQLWHGLRMVDVEEACQARCPGVTRLYSVWVYRGLETQRVEGAGCNQ